jgi:hypothetical protein
MHVVALQVGGVRQHQVGEGHHLRLEGVAHDEERDLVLPVLVPVVEHLAHLARVHDEFQAMLAMKMSRVSIGRGRRARRW